MGFTALKVGRDEARGILESGEGSGSLAEGRVGLGGEGDVAGSGEGEEPEEKRGGPFALPSLVVGVWSACSAAGAASAIVGPGSPDEGAAGLGSRVGLLGLSLARKPGARNGAGGDCDGAIIPGSSMSGSGVSDAVIWIWSSDGRASSWLMERLKVPLGERKLLPRGSGWGALGSTARWQQRARAWQ